MFGEARGWNSDLQRFYSQMDLQAPFSRLLGPLSHVSEHRAHAGHGASIAKLSRTPLRASLLPSSASAFPCAPLPLLL